MSKIANLSAIACGVFVVSAGFAWITAKPGYAQNTNGPSVTVVNGPTNPVPVKINEPISVEVTNEPSARIPFMQNSGLLIASAGSTGASFSMDVPEGFRLVVESVSFRASDSTSERFNIELGGTFNGSGAGQIPVYGNAFTATTLARTVPVLAFFDGGTSVTARYTKTTVSSLSNVFINVSGYLEPVP